MARIRSVKPEFWTDPDVVALSPLARLFFIGTWNHADDYGVLRDDPSRLKLQILPADEANAGELVDVLVDAGLLLRRVAPDGTNVLVIRTFCVHQKIDRRAVGRWGHPDDFTRNPADPHQSPPIPTGSTPGLEGTGLEGTVVVAPAKPPRKRQLPDDWSPNAAHRTKASDAGLDVADEADQFTNHHEAKGSTFVDWDKAFHTWLGNARKWQRGRQVTPNQKQDWEA
jgi:hypothetical protein